MNQRPIRLLLVDDHAVLRAGLESLLNAEGDMDVVGQAGDGAECVRLAAELQPDVILLDINMPHTNGLEAMAHLRNVAPISRILVLTMHDDEMYLRQVLASGGAGFVLKQAADSELLSAIRTVHSGGTFLHSAHTQALLNHDQAEPVPGDGELLARLSEREVEVLRLVAFGHSNKEIAEMLNLSVKTIETYKARVMEKLELRSRASLVRFALEHGLMDSGKA